MLGKIVIDVLEIRAEEIERARMIVFDSLRDIDNVEMRFVVSANDSISE